MAIIKDDLGLEVEESVLQRVQDPKFQETSSVLDYWIKRKAKEKELADLAAQEEAEKDKENNKLFGLF